MILQYHILLRVIVHLHLPSWRVHQICQYREGYHPWPSLIALLSKNTTRVITHGFLLHSDSRTQAKYQTRYLSLSANIKSEYLNFNYMRKKCGCWNFILISHNTVMKGGTSEGGVEAIVPDRVFRFTLSALKPPHARLHPYFAHMHERPSDLRTVILRLHSLCLEESNLIVCVMS